MAVAGIDIGSTTTKAVILEGDKILAFHLEPTGANAKETGDRVLAFALQEAGIDLADLGAVVATGYGRISVSFARRRVTEITCHGRGASAIFPGTRTVIDIGGQDSKVIRLDAGGMVNDFIMNDKCAAGTGRFLEVMTRVLEIKVADLSTLALKARKGAAISSTCTVFAESEVVGLIARGCPKEEIALGLCEAVAARLEGMVHRVGLEGEVMLTGGVALNEGVRRALERRLRVKFRVPPQPQLVGAYGAALLARDYMSDAV